MLPSLWICVLSGVHVHAHSTSHFQHWYPQYAGMFQHILEESCSPAFESYLEGLSHNCSYVSLTCLPGQVTDCILSNMAETLKANMAAAGVLLGLLPTILSFVGSNTTETALLALRRPLLAFLVATGAPAAAPTRTFEYRNVAEILGRKKDSLDVLQPARMTAAIIIILEYLFACASIANLAQVSWQLSIFTVCSFSPDSQFQPALWVFTALIIHLLGVWAFFLRVFLEGPSNTKSQLRNLTLKREFQLSVQQPETKIRFRQESYMFVFISWCTSTGTVLHILYGTMVFSSILFISTQDALSVVARYLASSIVCRVILMFEVSGMRAVVQVDENEQ